MNALVPIAARDATLSPTERFNLIRTANERQETGEPTSRVVRQSAPASDARINDSLEEILGTLALRLRWLAHGKVAKELGLQSDQRWQSLYRTATKAISDMSEFAEERAGVAA